MAGIRLKRRLRTGWGDLEGLVAALGGFLGGVGGRLGWVARRVRTGAGVCFEMSEERVAGVVRRLLEQRSSAIRAVTRDVT